MSGNGEYPNLALELVERMARFASKKQNRLGWGKENQRYKLVAYTFGSIITTYSVIDVLYDLNIDLISILSLPFYDFYLCEVVPFVLGPLRWAGFTYSSLYESVVIMSAIGASIWANAEFRTNQYLILFPFKNMQKHPGHVEFDVEKWKEKPVPPKPPRLFSVKSIIKLIEIVVLTYSGLGVVALLSGVIVGVRRLLFYIFEILMLTIGSVVYIFQHILYHLERFGDDEYWGTKVFLSVFIFRKNIDDTLDEHLNRRRLVFPGESGLFLLLEWILDDASRLCVGVFGLLTIALLASM